MMYSLLNNIYIIYKQLWRSKTLVQISVYNRITQSLCQRLWAVAWTVGVASLCSNLIHVYWRRSNHSTNNNVSYQVWYLLGLEVEQYSTSWNGVVIETKKYLWYKVLSCSIEECIDIQLCDCRIMFKIKKVLGLILIKKYS